MTIDEAIEQKINDYVEYAIDKRMELITRDILRKHMDFKVTVSKFAEIIGLKDQSIYRRIDESKLPFTKEGGTYLIDVKAILDNFKDYRFNYPEQIERKLNNYINEQINEKKQWKYQKVD